MKKIRAKLSNYFLGFHYFKIAFILLLVFLYRFNFFTTEALYSTNDTSQNNTFASTDWTPPPIPTLLSPANNSFVNTTGFTFDWTDVTDDLSNPVYYLFQSATDTGFTIIVTESGMLSASNYIDANITTDGEYYWRVRACDQLDNCSDWTTAWKITLDTTPPSIPGQIGWTTENPPVGSDYTGGSDFDNYKTCGGAVNYSPMTNLWAPSTDTNSITYDREVYTPIDNRIYSHLDMVNNYENGGGAVNGVTYWVRVRAKDIAGNYSNWTDKCAITYDITAPSSVSLSVTGSFTKSVEEKLTNGNFETGDLTGWTSAGNVALLSSDNITDPSMTITPYDGSSMVKIGNSDDPGNYVWENRLMQSFDAGAKSMSLHYNFLTRDFQDDPGFFIRINGAEVFKQSSPITGDGTTAVATDWQEFKYDLSTFSDGSKINLALYAGNTVDNNSQSWVYVDKITTYFVSAPAHAIYTLSGDDNLGGSGINHYEYNIDDTGWLEGSSFGNTPPISTGGNHTLQYRSQDNAGNYSPIYLVKIITDDVAPNAITDLAVSSTTANTVNLTWTAPGNDNTSGRTSVYDIRYSTTNITDANFDSAIKVDKIPSPKDSGQTESLEILGLNPSTTYYFAIKSSDEAPNTSALSNIPSGATTGGSTVNPGDIVINELMWMGTNQGTDDEWIELRNLTDHSIVLDNFTLTKYNGSSDQPMLTIPVGKTISPKGYFLIANFASNASHLKDTLTVDYESTDLDLSDSTLSIKLFDSSSQLIDQAWDGTAPKEGVWETTSGLEKYYSMERTSIPGDGTQPLNWYTCIDEASKIDFFDNAADERGTPGAENRSENEPLAHQSKFTRPEPTPTPSVDPSIEPSPSTEPSIDPSPTPLTTPGVESTVTPTQTPIPVNSPTPEITPVSENTPTPENTPIPESSPNPEPTAEVQPTIVTDSPSPTP